MISEVRLLVQSIKDVTIVRIQETSVMETLAIKQFSDELTELIDKQNRNKMILDFRMVKHLSSAALGMLVTLSKKAKMLKGDLVICSLNSDLQKLFKITNLDKLLTIKSSEEDSLGVFGRTSAG